MAVAGGGRGAGAGGVGSPVHHLPRPVADADHDDGERVGGGAHDGGGGVVLARHLRWMSHRSPGANGGEGNDLAVCNEDEDVI